MLVLGASFFGLLSSFGIRHSSFTRLPMILPPLRSLLILGRISNLPTVWSNCLAGWLLAGGKVHPRLGLLCAGASLLYTGGMFLNDACDVQFDRQYRTERPIPAGRISLRSVWLIAVALLSIGWLLLLPLTKMSALLATALVACIVIYDLIHKRTAFAPMLMAACRFLLYLVAAAAVQCDLSTALLWRAGALAAYICGISYLARSESAPITARAWPVALLFVPVLITFTLTPSPSAQWATAALAIIWLLWCLRGPFLKPRKPLASAVPGLLGGIVLVDWMASGVGFTPFAILFVCLLLLALALQKIAPAT
jgi:hypothetical protein